ncbi:uncharacterized protein ACDP82_006255 [Pangshura tecta]
MRSGPVGMTTTTTITTRSTSPAMWRYFPTASPRHPPRSWSPRGRSSGTACPQWQWGMSTRTCRRPRGSHWLTAWSMSTCQSLDPASLTPTTAPATGRVRMMGPTTRTCTAEHEADP